MRKYLFTVLIFILVETVFSQSKKDSTKQDAKSYVSISVGAAIPQSDYGLKDLTQVSSGFARTGINMEIAVAKIIKGKTGIIFMYKNQSNSIDQTSYSSQYAVRNPGISWNIVSNPWKINAFLVGSYSSFPLGQKKRVSLDLKLLAGMVKATSRQLIAIGQQGSVPIDAEQLANTTNAFAYCVGLGLKFEISTNCFILLHADYLNVSPTFKNVFFRSLSGNSYVTSFNQDMSTLNCSIGLAFRID
jgi:hypothetical protein